MKRLLTLISLIITLNTYIKAVPGSTPLYNVRGCVYADSINGETLAGATVSILRPAQAFFTDSQGGFLLHMPAGKYTLSVNYVGFKPYTTSITVPIKTELAITLKPTDDTLNEVIITAREHGGLSSASTIDREAMNHLQPTSFTDLLELLPGNISKTPNMSSVNSIALRETGTLDANGNRTSTDDYAISSLGTLFMVDGAPINTDANLQSEGLPGSDVSSPAAMKISTNHGVDMRNISTDNIESVEIVRGIPSAEYGNLTSGVVKIKRLRRSTPFTFRFKADEYSKLFSASKGISLMNHDHILSLDIGYLDSKADPRDLHESYKRITGSARMSMRFNSTDVMTIWNYGIDYTSSVDNTRIDPDLNYRKIDEFKSDYKRMALTSDLTLSLQNSTIFDILNINTSVSYQIDRLWHRKQVAPQRASVTPSSMMPGESIGFYLLSEYISEYESDGRPFNAFIKARASGSLITGLISNNYKIGAEWNLSKNFGRGQIYDLSKPLTAGWSSRPRTYRDIPALQVLSFFAENNFDLPAGTHLAEIQFGLRTIQLPGLSGKYLLRNKIYIDPRINSQWKFPQLHPAGIPLTFSLCGGYGLTTKMPTIDYLYPQCNYNDFIQLNYFDTEHPVQNSIVSLMTYIDDATNYQLRPARNHKWEIRLSVQWGHNRLNITYFQERMRDGFRYSTIYAPYSYKKYDVSAIDGRTLTGPPDLSTLPYTQAIVLDGFRRATNGTRIDKQGVEVTLNTARWQPLHTALTVTGAWFKSTYSNSQMLFSPVNDVVDGIPVSDMYVGLYDYRDGRVNEQLNTNFMFDTQIPRWGLIFSTTIQCMWYVKTTRLPQNGVPMQYLTTEGVLHEYDQEAQNDAVLQFLTKYYNPDNYRTQRIPFAGYLNLKATKAIGKHLRIALFVNKILDWLPDYTSNGLTIRRSTSSYFGMEINLTL